MRLPKQGQKIDNKRILQQLRQTIPLEEIDVGNKLLLESMINFNDIN
jgi:hypothetical protein